MSTFITLFLRESSPMTSDDDDRSREIIVGSITTFFVATLVLPLRLHCRRSTKQSLWWDDYFVIIAYILSFVILTIVLIWTSLGLGKHLSTVQRQNPNSVPIMMKMLIPAEFCYAGGILFTKYSILAFYWRIFPVRSMKILVRIMVVIVTLWIIGGGTACLLSCIPLRRFWDPSVPGTCLKVRTLYIGAAIPNVITDFAILIMPLPYVWHLKISMQKRIGLSISFIFGGFICVISLIRLVLIIKLSFQDLTWDFIQVLIWTNLELFAGVICACLPMLRPLFIKQSNAQTPPASNSKHPGVGGPRSSLVAKRVGGPPRNGSFSSFLKVQKHGSWAPKTTVYAASQKDLESDLEDGDMPHPGPKDIVMTVKLEIKEDER